MIGTGARSQTDKSHKTTTFNAFAHYCPESRS